MHEFHVYVCNSELEDDWDFRFKSYDLSEAVEVAERLARGVQVSGVFEKGRFKVKRKWIEDDVLFWWSKNAYALFEGPPIGRGKGWYEEESVSYEAVEQAEESEDEEDEEEDSDEDYARVVCNDCLKEFSGKYAFQYDEEQEVGRSSGSSRVGRSATYGASGARYRHSSSRSSGRTQYRNVTLILCEDCYDQRKAADRQWLIMKIIAWVIGAAVLFYWARSH